MKNPSSEIEKKIENAEKGFILGISSISSKEIENQSSRKRSRPDGWITDGNNVILIESKLDSKFSKRQLKKHHEELEKHNLRIEERDPILWQDIDSVLRILADKGKNLNQAEKDIIREFRRYIQMNEICLDFEKFYYTSFL